MFFNSPARPLRQIVRASHSAFSLEVFRVSDLGTQQAILLGLLRFRRRGVKALGTHWQGETYVVADCRTRTHSARVRRVVLRLDPRATVTFSSGQHEHLRVAS